MERDTKLETEVLATFTQTAPHILCFNQITSLMDLARDFAHQQPALFLSKSQTQGRGQQGRSWESCQGALLACISLKLDTKFLVSVSQLSLVFAIQIAKVLQQFSLLLKLKWPNDIFVASNHKKICGILLETSNMVTSQEILLRVGIGLNLIEHPANSTSILAETGVSPEIALLASDIYKNCEKALEIFKLSGFEAFMADWNNLDSFINKSIQFEYNGSKYSGISRGVNKQAQLLIESDSQIHSFSSGRISI